MRRLFAVLMVCAVTSALVARADEQAEANPKSDVIFPNWKVGDSHRYILTKSRQRTENGQVQKPPGRVHRSKLGSWN